jgi:hypothetical protein
LPKLNQACNNKFLDSAAASQSVSSVFIYRVDYLRGGRASATAAATAAATAGKERERKEKWLL